MREEKVMQEKILVTQSSMPPFEEYVEMIKPLWESHWLTNMGKYHQELETQLADYLGVQQISLTANGHMALELAIQSLNLPQGGEVITTPYTFISTTHAIIRNCLVPVFCDVKEDYTIDEEKIEDLITEKTVAIVPVHVYGNICNIERIQQIADKYDLKVVYDAAHAFGERIEEEGVGSFGDLTVFSFHATKVYNTIEGGCVCCKTKEQYDKLYNLKNFGIRSEELIVSVGANAKLNEFQAAMGLCNLKHVDEYIKKRGQIVKCYENILGSYEKIKLNQYRKDLQPNYAYMPILLENESIRNKVYDGLKENRIYTRKYFSPITADAACFRNKYKKNNLNCARDFSKRILVLPLYAELPVETAEKIAALVIELAEEGKK